MAKEKEKIHTETHQFGAETGKILQLMIHSLYTNKDIFLRELVSNASDACDKLRYEALSHPDLLKEDNDLKISILPITLDNTLTISDNGIGMNKEDLISQLGTIAKSGTQNFLEKLSGDQEKDIQLIGQFGVGFYSSFMVADEVTVTSRKAGEATAHIWHSTGNGEFTVEESIESHPRGTSIKLKLKKDARDYLDKHKIEHVIKTYSNHISIPVIMEDEAGGESATINKANAIWSKSKSEISDEEYTEFYHQIAHAHDEPLLTLHNKNEGTIEYTNLLYIPSSKPFDLFHPDRKCRVKLYVKRVFINEEGIDILPQFLRFVQGVVDSEDLPLNISRESLQHNATINRINKAITKKIIKELDKMSSKQPEQYDKFWQNFGAVLKEGLCDATNDRDAILDVCRFYTSKSGDKQISLQQYLDNMKEGQEKILYISADTVEAARKSPQLEGFIKNDVEVLLLTDSVDDFWTNVTQEYKDKAFASITRTNIDPENIGQEEDDTAMQNPEQAAESAKKKAEEAEQKLSDQEKKLISFIKETLKDRVADVKISTRLTESPVCLSASEYSMDIRMERFLVEQKQLPQSSAKILEINAGHSILQSLASDIANNPERAKEVASMLFDQACIIEGETIPDTSEFSKRLSQFMEQALQQPSN